MSLRTFFIFLLVIPPLDFWIEECVYWSWRLLFLLCEMHGKADTKGYVMSIQ
jgi:hypothetical protein